MYSLLTVTPFCLLCQCRIYMRFLAYKKPNICDVRRRVKITRLRARVAERLKGAQNTYAMLTTFNEIDMTNLMQMRSDYKVDLVSITRLILLSPSYSSVRCSNLARGWARPRGWACTSLLDKCGRQTKYMKVMMVVLQCSISSRNIHICLAPWRLVAMHCRRRPSWRSTA